MWFIIGWLLSLHNHLSYEVEVHASVTYAKYLALVDPNDQDIIRIMNDEIQHFQELNEAMEMIK